MTPVLTDNPQIDATNDAHSTMPWWVRATTIFGVPAVIALYLVWAITTGQMAILTRIEATLQAQKAAVAEVAALTESTTANQEDSNRRQEVYLRLLCVNSAKTQADRNTCLTVR